MRKTEFLIIGQGISGTFLSWNLQQAGRSFIVIDNEDPASSSRVAAGIINPVTGRRIVQTWMIDILLPFALEEYEKIGKHLDIEAITRKDIIDFFPSVQMLQAFEQRIIEDPKFLSMPSDPGTYSGHFNYDFGFGEISPSYSVNLMKLLPAWRNFLTSNDQLLVENFDISKLVINQQVSYKDITSEKIIFCDGIQSVRNPWFKNLPFALNKGEALIIRNDELPADRSYKKGLTMVPLQDGLFWVGSSYQWEFADMQPSEQFHTKTVGLLKSWLKSPFEVESQLVSIRPATVERRPFVGMHPHYPQLGILNGMGTKGCSLAPYFASQFVSHLTKKSSILPEANVDRFSRLLKSNS